MLASCSVHVSVSPALLQSLCVHACARNWHGAELLACGSVPGARTRTDPQACHISGREASLLAKSLPAPARPLVRAQAVLLGVSLPQIMLTRAEFMP